MVKTSVHLKREPLASLIDSRNVCRSMTVMWDQSIREEKEA